MKQIFLLLTFLHGINTSAQISVTTTSLRYIQNFDSLDASGSAQTNMPAGWSFFEWGGASANGTYRAGTGSGTSGDTYSYGATGSSERALGSLCSSGLQNVSFGMCFVNRTSSYLNAVDISFRTEQWRRNGSGKTDSTLFYYSTFTQAAITDTSFSHWVQVPELLTTSVTTALPAAALNGNDTFRKISFQLPLALPPGDTICFRWYDYNAAANDDGLAIDSLEMIFHVGIPAGLFRPKVQALYPEPGTQHVAPSTVPYIVFDRKITKGNTGGVYIKDRSTQLTQTLSVSSSKLYLSGDTARLYLLNLKGGTRYQITFDSTTFDTAGFHCLGLYDTSAWTFSTEATYVNQVQVADRFVVENPVLNGNFSLRFNGTESETIELLIYDLQGRVVQKSKHSLDPPVQTLRFSLDLPRGMYLLVLRSGKGILQRKIQWQ